MTLSPSWLWTFHSSAPPVVWKVITAVEPSAISRLISANLPGATTTSPSGVGLAVAGSEVSADAPPHAPSPGVWPPQRPSSWRHEASALPRDAGAGTSVASVAGLEVHASPPVLSALIMRRISEVRMGSPGFGTHDTRQKGVLGMMGENRVDAADFGGFQNILQHIETCLEVDPARQSAGGVDTNDRSSAYSLSSPETSGVVERRCEPAGAVEAAVFGTG